MQNTIFISCGAKNGWGGGFIIYGNGNLGVGATLFYYLYFDSNEGRYGNDAAAYDIYSPTKFTVNPFSYCFSTTKDKRVCHYINDYTYPEWIKNGTLNRYDIWKKY